MGTDRFPTSREVYHRIRWDPRLDAREYVIGYETRFGALEDVALVAFAPDGDIPWHRVWVFRRGSLVVWDRRERTHRLGALADGAPPAPPASSLTPLCAVAFDRATGTWTVAAPQPARALREVSLATFNVLFDRYDADRLDTPRRTVAALAELRALDTDLLALQEVTAPFLRALLDAPWVRERYTVSDGPAATTVEPYGQVILARVPIASLHELSFTREKRAVIGEIALPGGSLWLAALHLTSNRDPSGASARATELRTLTAWARACAAESDVVLAGDLNLADDSPEARELAGAGWIDVWSALRPGQTGHTYDPARNALAALTTTSGRAQRLDRVLVLSRSGRLAAHDVRLFAQDPIDGPPGPSGAPLFVSDHAGVRCALRLAAPAAPRIEAARVHQSAIVLLPPEGVWGPIQALRAAHDRHYERWMPHVTLVYPFVPEEHFAQAEAALTDALRDLQPFEVRLERFGRFDHRGNVTAWLRPDDHPTGAIVALHAALEAALPAPDAPSAGSSRGFTPHLSVGQLPGATANATVAAWQRDWAVIAFPVREVCLISRRGDEPFQVRVRVPIGRHEPLRAALMRRPEWAHAADHERRTAATSRLEQVCAALDCTLHPYGSVLLGATDAQSDVDAVVVGGRDREAFVRELVAALAQTPSCRDVRDVALGVMPVVRLVLDDVRMELAYVHRPAGVPACGPMDLLARHAAQLDTASVRALLGIADALALLEAVSREGAGLARFRTVLLAVRAWAKARGVYSHASGYLGGLSWAVLVAWCCRRAPAGADSDEQLLARVVGTFAEWAWPSPVAVTPKTLDYVPAGPRDRMPVIAPALPLRNTARNVSRSTQTILCDELARARDVIARARAAGTVEAWDELFATRPEESRPRVVIAVDAPTSDARTAAAGWILGHLTALLYRLEEEPALTIWPLPAGSTGPFVLALEAPGGRRALDGLVTPALEAFRDSFLAWSGRPAGATLAFEVRDA